MLKALLLCSLTLLSAGNPDVIDLTLKEAILRALEKNRDIQIQEQNVRIAEGEITTQEGTFDPVLDISSSYTDSQIPTVSTFIESGSINEEALDIQSGVSGKLSTGTFYEILNFSVTRTETNSPIESLSPNISADLSFSIGQELLKNFGTDINRTFIRVAKKDTQISYDEYERIISEVLLNVESDYWLLVAARQNLDLEQKALELALDLQERNKAQVEVGVLPPVAITQAEAEVAARKVDLINAENRLERAQDRLKNRIVLSLDKDIRPVDEPSNYDVVLDKNQALEQAYNNRPEIDQAKKEIDKSEHLKNYYANQRLPSLSVEGVIDFQGIGGDPNPNRLIFTDPPPEIPAQFNDQSDAFTNLYEGEFPTWTILGTLSYPIFNRKAKGDYIKAEATLNRNIIELQRLKEGIQLEIRNAIRSVMNSKRKVDAALVSVELANEVLNNENEKFNVGLATTRDILEAQRDLIDAQTSKINAITEFNISLAELEKAKGTILEANDIILDRDALKYEQTK